MRFWLTILGAGAFFALATTLLLRSDARGEQPVALEVEAPEFEGIDAWINSKPLTFKDLRGQVVVVHFWTFG
jgi:hypothetical protein